MAHCPTNNQPDVEDGTLSSESPDQQLAGRIAVELISKRFTTEAKKESLASKIAAGQMDAEDWRTMAASTLQTENQVEEEENAVDANGGEQS